MNGAWRSGLRFSALAAALTMIHGCGTLPDQGLAREAMARGDYETARKNYAALAEDGYADAQAGMGDLTASAGDPASLKEAEGLVPAGRAGIGQGAVTPGPLVAASGTDVIPSKCKRPGNCWKARWTKASSVRWCR